MKIKQILLTNLMGLTLTLCVAGANAGTINLDGFLDINGFADASPESYTVDFTNLTGVLEVDALPIASSTGLSTITPFSLPFPNHLFTALLGLLPSGTYNYPPGVAGPTGLTGSLTNVTTSADGNTTIFDTVDYTMLNDTISFTLVEGAPFTLSAEFNDFEDQVFANFNIPQDGRLDDVFSTNITTSAVPLPAAFWMMGSGLLALLGVARKKK